MNDHSEWRANLEEHPELALQHYLAETVQREFSGSEENREVIAGTAAMFIPKILEAARQPQDLKSAYFPCRQALDFVRRLFLALHPTYGLTAPNEQPNYLWRHLKKRDFKPVPGNSLDKETLSDLAAEYLSRSPTMHHDFVEWCIVDALVWTECWAFTYEESQIVTHHFPFGFSRAFDISDWCRNRSTNADCVMRSLSAAYELVASPAPLPN